MNTSETRALALLALAVVALGCSAPKDRAPAAPPPALAGRPTAAPTPEKVEVHVQVKVAGQFATKPELELRNALEDLLASKGLGEVVDAGTGLGVMDLFLETDQPTEAQRVITEFLGDKQLLARATIQVVSPGRPDRP